MNPTDLLAQLAEHIKRIEAERDEALAEAARARHAEGEALDLVAELRLKNADLEMSANAVSS